MRNKILWAFTIALIAFVAENWVVADYNYKLGLREGTRGATMNKVVMTPFNEVGVVNLQKTSGVKLALFSSVEDGKYKERVCAGVGQWPSDTNPVLDIKGDIIGTMQYAPH